MVVIIKTLRVAASPCPRVYPNDDYLIGSDIISVAVHPTLSQSKKEALNLKARHKFLNDDWFFFSKALRRVTPLIKMLMGHQFEFLLVARSSAALSIRALSTLPAVKP